MFLAEHGKPIKSASLSTEFARLVSAAGYPDVKACLSMFRHRFITYEVIVHLKEFMAKCGKTHHLITDSDYMSILKKVATKTGHKSVKSLWHYIDLAWAEINVWGGVENAIERLHAADRLFEELLDLKYTLDSTKADKATMAIVQEISAKLAVMLNTGKQDLVGGQ